MRAALSAFVLGTFLVAFLPWVPPWWGTLAASAAFAAAWLAWGRLIGGRLIAGRRRSSWLVVVLCALAAGSALALLRADLRLRDALAPELDDRRISLTFQVMSLATPGPTGERFEARALSAPPGVPARFLLTSKLGRFVPGEVWRGRVELRPPHGNVNPYGFDYEGYLFERGIRALGTVRGTPRRVADEPWSGFTTAVQRVRHHAREQLAQALGPARYGPVLTALAMGDQAGVAREDWDAFRRLGITHLVSISGLHVTMLAALAGWAVLRASRRLVWRGAPLCERLPAQIAAAWAAVCTAWLYCLLAGWGVPAQRTFFMLAVAASASVARLPLSASRVLPLAAAVVCALDPWAAQAPGFWLSFGAVAMLVLGSAGRWRRDPSSQDKSWLSRLLDTLRSGAHAQALLTIGLLPLLALLFQQISLVSPLANAVAIPLVSLAVTPLALAATLLCLVPGMSGAAVIAGQWAHGLFAGMMRLLQPLADAPQASLDLAAPPWPWVALALFGVVWAMQPRGLPGRAWALTLLLPLLLYRPARPDTGDWRMTLLDVGQGSAAVIETAHGAVLYDTGPRLGPEADAGERIIAPFLRARGIGRLDHLVVSHADMDHAGGLGSLLQALPVNTLHASYDVPGAVPAWPKATAFSRCAAGQSWVQDGVEFAFLHPAIATRNDPRAGDRNETSCVLRVSGRHHRALLPGDIGAKEEAMLDADDVTVDVVALPHHGSRFSSSTGFVGAVHAAHAVAQAGYRNRYGHPSPEVLRRWEAAGSLVHRSDRDGALTFVSRPRGLIVRREREVQRRYWRRP